MLPTLKIGTRSSVLALWQARFVEARLQAAGFATELVTFETTGDKIQSVSLSKIGSKGVFTQELEDALLDGRIHLAVHSAKDMPAELPPGLELIAFTEREPADDVLISFKEDLELTTDSAFSIGTSSTRRRALLARYYPNIQVVEARGNLQTRLRKLEEGQFHALLLAYAGVHRLGWEHLIRQRLPQDSFTPQPGQGALAIEASVNLPKEVQGRIVTALNHPETSLCIKAERAYLATLGGGCSIPTFGFASHIGSELTLNCGIVSLDGQREVRQAFSTSVSKESYSVATAEELGTHAGRAIAAAGGRAILDEIRDSQHPAM